MLDESNEKIGYKIRLAQQEDRAPYMLVLGAKEAEAGNLSVRNRKGETTAMDLDAFTAQVKGRDRQQGIQRLIFSHNRRRKRLRALPLFGKA